MTTSRRLGRSGIEAGAIGVGTWAIGGRMTRDGQDFGWGAVNDDESARALQHAVDLGATLIDTADVYGTGHPERMIARALGSRRDELIWATKWGNTYAENTRALTCSDASVAYARRALEASLRRLETDRVDLWQLHGGDLTPTQADDLVALCEQLVTEGLIRGYGWSTDDPAQARRFAVGQHCTLVQHTLDVLDDAPQMLEVCEEHDLAGIDRSPLVMGLLSDRITADTVLPAGDVRTTSPAWLSWFNDGRPSPEFLQRREVIRDLLTGGGRTLAQGALAWVLARSPRTIPIAGIRTVAQARENVGTLTAPRLSPEEFAHIEALLRPPVAALHDHPANA